MKKTIQILLIFLFIVGIRPHLNFAQLIEFNGGATPQSICITENEYLHVANNIEGIPFDQTNALADTVYFADPIGDGGINSFGKPINNYVDHDAGPGLLDYMGGTVTYDGHNGTDIDILDFYDMDEGIPVLAAASGWVISVHDGEFDRNTTTQSNTEANYVIIRHSDLSEAWYWHFKKHSIRVEYGKAVSVGDTLGMAGSSGYSTAPHLHFEIRHYSKVVDPFFGPFQPKPSRWIEQPTYIFDLPFELMIHGLTTMPVSWETVLERPPAKRHVTAGSRIYSWIRLRNLRRSDRLTWRLLANGVVWTTHSFSAAQDYRTSWWYVQNNLPSSSGYYGNWNMEIYYNGALFAEQPFSYDGQPN